jgi:acetyl/propionyl-CoA carboxylase alpha subunit
MVANRGEIARRVIKTCNRLGVPTVAVYTDSDALAPHVKEATHAACLGANPRSYTDQAKLLEVRSPA